jgi:RNA polymerase sigma-70 factor, ECF subfamily
MDLKHFPDFYQANVKRVYRYFFYRLRGNEETAQDLTQDVFMKALKAFDRYDPEISQASWIFTISRNHLINFVQKERPGVPLEDIEDSWWDRIDGIEKMALKNDEKRLLSAIKQLPEDDADLVRLKHLEGWTFDEIAQVKGKNSGALRVQAHRALKNLKKILKHL